jgi:hypothetical protein
VVGVFLLVGCDNGTVKVLQGDLLLVAAFTVSHSRCVCVCVCVCAGVGWGGVL